MSLFLHEHAGQACTVFHGVETPRSFVRAVLRTRNEGREDNVAPTIRVLFLGDNVEFFFLELNVERSDFSK